VRGNGKSLGGSHDSGATPSMLPCVTVVGAGEHARDLGDGEPPGAQADDEEHQMRRVEVVLEYAGLLGRCDGVHLLAVVPAAVQGVGHPPTGQALPQQKAGQPRIRGVVVEGPPGPLTDVLQGRRRRCRGR